MRAYWILPNRDQRDDIAACDGETIRPLREILDPKTRPAGFSHGVPTELLEKVTPIGVGQILFAQRFPRWNGAQTLFSVTTPAGVDATGRVVHIGMLFVLDPRERPSFELSYAALSPQDRRYAHALVDRLTAPPGDDVWAESVHDLAVLGSDAGPATNVALARSAVRFRSRYTLAAGGWIARADHRAMWRAAALVLLIVLAVLAWWLHVHGKGALT
jgi:hypothetical protein